MSGHDGCCQGESPTNLDIASLLVLVPLGPCDPTLRNFGETFGSVGITAVDPKYINFLLCDKQCFLHCLNLSESSKFGLDILSTTDIYKRLIWNTSGNSSNYYCGPLERL